MRKHGKLVPSERTAIFKDVNLRWPRIRQRAAQEAEACPQLAADMAKAAAEGKAAKDRAKAAAEGKAAADKAKAAAERRGLPWWGRGEAVPRARNTLGRLFRGRQERAAPHAEDRALLNRLGQEEFPCSPLHGGGGQEAENCAVCQERFRGGDKLSRFPCLHRFHADCIGKALQYSQNCPVCKFNLRTGKY